MNKEKIQNRINEIDKRYAELKVFADQNLASTESYPYWLKMRDLAEERNLLSWFLEYSL